MTPIPACAPLVRPGGCESAVVVTVTMGVMVEALVEALVEAGKSELWKRIWTEKAFSPPLPVAANEPIRLLEE